jgi:hypothetical protein
VSFALLFIALLRARYRLATIADAGFGDGVAGGSV